MTRSSDCRYALNRDVELMRQCLNEDFGVEFSDVCRFSTQTDKFYPYMELVFYGDAVDRGLAKTEYLGDYRKI